MSKKDFLIKEIDAIIEKIRFWRNLLIALLSGLAAMLFGLSQKKLVLNHLTYILFISGVILIILITYLIKKEEDKRQKLLEKLKKEK
ncbi:hypothetical protein [Caminibacter sp.]